MENIKNVKGIAVSFAQDLQRGDFIENSELERVFEAKKYTKDFGLGVLHLRNTCLERGLFIKQERGGVRILRDSEGVVEERKRFMRKIRGANKGVIRLKKHTKIDNLTPDEREEYYTTVNAMDRLMQPVRDIVKESRLLAKSLKEKSVWPRLGSGK